MSIKARLPKDGMFEVDEELAGLVPMATSIEQTALTIDIDENGQQEPIVLWRGKVVDGRCRMKALSVLKQPILYKELDDTLSKEDVATFVKSVNTRRNLTLTQKAIAAAKEYLKNKPKSMAEMAKAWAIGEGTFKNAVYICKRSNTIAEHLFNGNTVDILNPKNEEVQSNKISAVYAYLKRIEENVGNLEEDHAWSANSFINTQAGKEWFYDFIKKHGIKNIDVMKELAIAANAKYKKNKTIHNSNTK